jgi:hypothetical protein
MHGMINAAGYLLFAVLFFAGATAAWKRISRALDCSYSNTTTFFVGGIGTAMATISVSRHVAEGSIPYLLPLAIILAAPAAFLLLHVAVYGGAAAISALKTGFKKLQSSIDWAANTGLPPSKKDDQGSNDSAANGRAIVVPPPTSPVNSDSIFPDGF